LKKIILFFCGIIVSSASYSAPIDYSDRNKVCETKYRDIPIYAGRTSASMVRNVVWYDGTPYRNNVLVTNTIDVFNSRKQFVDVPVHYYGSGYILTPDGWGGTYINQGNTEMILGKVPFSHIEQEEIGETCSYILALVKMTLSAVGV